MVKIEILFKQKKISRINEFELARYTNFFENSYKNNLEHSKFILESFPRWSIISGYYAMHDIAKLFIAKQSRIKIDYDVHSSTISVLRGLIKSKELLMLMEKGYEEFISLANDLAVAKKDRTKAQYYTGTRYMHEEYRKRAKEFLSEVVEPFLSKISLLLEK